MSERLVDLDFREEISMLKDAYKCSKCNSETFVHPLLLKTCRHIFCSRCLVIKGTQVCPKCGDAYKPKDVDRDNSLVKAILVKVRRIDELLSAQDYRLSNVSIADIRDYIQKLECEENTPAEVSSQTISETLTPERENVEEESEYDKFIKFHIPVPDVLKNFQINTKIIKRNEKGETGLHLACKRRNIDELRTILKTGIDVNCVDWSNWTPLHEAVQAGSLECVQELLEAGCLVNVPAKNYLTPLHLAAESRNHQICALLVQYGADPSAKDQFGNAICDLSPNLPGNPLPNIPPRILTYHFNLAKEYCKNLTDAGEKLLKAFSVWHRMEHLLVSAKFVAEEQIGVLTSLLLAVPFLNATKMQQFINCNETFVEVIPVHHRAAFFRSLTNRLHNLPKLFDGMNIHLPPNVRYYRVHTVLFTREELQGLIEVGGGRVLKRAPTETTIAECTQQAFHCRNDPILAHCSHFVLYDSHAPPLLLYKMKELKHISALWLTECIYDFRIHGED